jgi:hypothetical protein
VCAGDCDDGDNSVYPGASEQCNGEDDDCDGTVPANEADADGDLHRICAGDCDDSDAAVHPNASEQCNGEDDDCDGALPADEHDSDNDSYMVCDNDCNDGNPAVYPGATEVCNGEDDDCNGTLPVDERDTDGDGWMGCEGDCDDSTGAVHPGQSEVCDGLDNDCDGNTDQDGAGEGVCGIGEDCVISAGYCSGALYCQHNNADGRNLCTHWCNNSHELPGDSNDSHECPADYACSLYSNTDSAGFCWPNSGGAADTGDACASDDDCRSGWCDTDLNRCIGGCSSIIGCRNTGNNTSNWSCVLNSVSSANGNMHHGLCGPAAGAGVTGDVCYDNNECRDGFCDFWAGSYGDCENLCCTHADCPPNYYCAIWLGQESSVIKACDWGSGGAGAFGDACASDGDCASMVCLDVGEGSRCNSYCCRDTDCPAGYICDFAFYVDMDPYDDALGRACVPE